MTKNTNTPVFAEPGVQDLTTIDPTTNPTILSAMQRPRKILNDLFAAHPDWAEYFDDVDPFSATHEELIDLINSAPTEGAVMLLYGFYSARVEIAAMTGRPFF